MSCIPHYFIFLLLRASTPKSPFMWAHSTPRIIKDGLISEEAPWFSKRRTLNCFFIVSSNVSDKLPWKTLSGDRNPLKLNVAQLTVIAVENSQPAKRCQDYSVQISPGTFQRLTPALLWFHLSAVLWFHSNDAILLVCVSLTLLLWRRWCGGGHSCSLIIRRLWVGCPLYSAE